MIAASTSQFGGRDAWRALRRRGSRIGVHMRARARAWRADARGIAAVEFALIVPVMSVLMMGAIELSQALMVDRRVTQVASSTADLIARSEKSITEAEVRDIMRIGGFIMKPNDQGPLQITLRSIISSPANAAVTKQ
jgi:Flp pilus assembly protein TadG